MSWVHFTRRLARRGAAVLIAVATAVTITTAAPAAGSAPHTKVTQAATGPMTIVNYFPSMYAQGRFWNPWHPEVVNADFGVIAGTLHANTVRIFVPTQQFGFPGKLNTTYTAELSKLVGIAANHGLRVYLNLFNYYVPYTDIADSQSWARQLLAPYAGDPRIAAVEIQNEINPYDASAISWAKAMIPYVRSVDGGIPVAVSVCGCNFYGDLKDLVAYLGASQPDIYDFHYYPDPNANPSPTEAANITESSIEWVLSIAKYWAGTTGARLVVGETGESTFYPDAANSPSAASDPQIEQTQADYYTKVEQAAVAAGLPPAGTWDYIDTAYGGGVSDTTQRFFGLFRMDGTPKPAAAVVAQAFSH